MSNIETKKTPDLSEHRLAQFTGTQVWYRHPLVRRITYTEGVKYVADEAGAYWLLDEIATSQLIQTIAGELFQSWTLVVDQEKHTAVLTMQDSKEREVYRKLISFTDFPADKITFWFTDNVILLPSEY